MESPEFYPRELWTQSPVYNSFVKLFIKDIHALQHLPQEGLRSFGNGLTVGDRNSVRFWLNHPIRWVQVIGVVVSITQKEKADSILRTFRPVQGHILDWADGESMMHREQISSLS